MLRPSLTLVSAAQVCLVMEYAEGGSLYNGKDARARSSVPLLSTCSLATPFQSEDLATTGLVWNLGMMGWHS